MANEVKKTALEEQLEAEMTEAAEEEAVEMEPVDEAAEDDGETVEAIVEPEAEEDTALADMTAERDALKDQLLRHRAEFDNYRKRMAREAERLRKTASASLVRDLLPVVDNLERAFDHVEDKTGPLAQGVEMVLSQFYEVLGGHEVEPIAALGELFDPNVHEALSHLPSEEYPADTVMQEYQRGYRMAGNVLRPAKVVVSSGAPAEAEDQGDTQDQAEDDAPAQE